MTGTPGLPRVTSKPLVDMQMSMISEHERVVLTTDLPNEGLVSAFCGVPETP